MEYRQLGNTGLKVSVIGMGCEGLSEDNYNMAQKMFDAAERLGINYFDLYASDPRLRQAVGRALRGRRDRFMIQSHICSVWKNGQYTRTRNLAETKAGFEEMMTLLDTDYLDVGMIHYCDAMGDWESIVDNGILDYARELKKQGRIRHIGLSSHNPLVAERAVTEGGIEVLMFSVNPCYDLQPATEDCEEMWADRNYQKQLTNMDPDRQRLYEVCQRMGVGITVMKVYAGGELLGSNQIAGVSLTPNQCISYALSRPAVSAVLPGAHSVEELEQSAAYCEAGPEEKDYAAALASFPRVSWVGHCMYCTHCEPCPKFIDIASVTKFLHLAQARSRVTGHPEQCADDGDCQIPETVREHYAALEHHAGECIKCGACEGRCPFGVAVRENMEQAVKVFGY